MTLNYNAELYISVKKLRKKRKILSFERVLRKILRLLASSLVYE